MIHPRVSYRQNIDERIEGYMERLNQALVEIEQKEGVGEIVITHNKRERKWVITYSVPDPDWVTIHTRLFIEMRELIEYVTSERERTLHAEIEERLDAVVKELGDLK